MAGAAEEAPRPLPARSPHWRPFAQLGPTPLALDWVGPVALPAPVVRSEPDRRRLDSRKVRMPPGCPLCQPPPASVERLSKRSVAEELAADCRGASRAQSAGRPRPRLRPSRGRSRGRDAYWPSRTGPAARVHSEQGLLPQCHRIFEAQHRSRPAAPRVAAVALWAARCDRRSRSPSIAVLRRAASPNSYPQSQSRRRRLLGGRRRRGLAPAATSPSARVAPWSGRSSRHAPNRQTRTGNRTRPVPAKHWRSSARHRN